MSVLANIIATPREALAIIRTEPRWLSPAATYMFVLFLLLWLGGCWRNITEGLSWSFILGPALISPLIVIVVSLWTTPILYLLMRAIPGKIVNPGFKAALSLNLHCAVIIVLGEIVNFLLVHADLLGDSGFPLQNRFPVGLDLVFLILKEPGIYMAIILHCTSVFVIWYLVVLARGIGIMTGASRTKSGLIVATLWGSVVLSVLGLVYAAGGGTTIRITM